MIFFWTIEETPVKGFRITRFGVESVPPGGVCPVAWPREGSLDGGC